MQGHDDLGLEADLVREILATLPQEEVLSLLPETAESLRAFASLRQQDIATYLKNWQKAPAARLKHQQLQPTPAQLEIVDEILAQLLPEARTSQGENPNARCTAPFLLCQNYLKHNGDML